MIRFKCPGCDKTFNVPEHYAGKSATCNKCKTLVVVPVATDAVMGAVSIASDFIARDSMTSTRPVTAGNIDPPHLAPPLTPRLPPRQRRLLADAEQIRRVFSNGEIIRLKTASGDPPELYEIEYAITGVGDVVKNQPVLRQSHLVEIQMTSDYPRLSPRCRMLTPIFHPNIDKSSICVGDHWTAGERLAELVVRIGEMIAYQAYNIKSPLNGEAAMWADLNHERLPVDSRFLRPVTME